MLRPRKQPLSTTSVVVPCASQHVNQLPGLIVALEQQTVPPDEVTISISDCSEVPDFLKRAIQVSPIKVYVCTEPTLAYAGKNRNRAVQNSTGDILIYQDADDLPHPQRVEVVKRLIGEFEVDHLMHHYEHLQNDHDEIKRWRESRFEVLRAQGVARYVPYGDDYAHPFHNGNCCTTRSAFREIQWSEDIKRGQDVAYNRQVCRKFAGTMARIPWKLVAYRQFLSSTKFPRRRR